MADTPPNNPLPGAPTGAEPLKKSTGKVQPKKETVRINLPPKPTAAPTIKLPTLPPGGPTGAPSPAPAAAPAPVRTAAAPAAVAPPAHGTSLAKAGGAPAAAAPAPASSTQRPAVARTSAPVIPTIKMVDKVLIFSAAVLSLVAVGAVGWVYKTLADTLNTFTP